jgi:hypothetical protein
VLLVTVSDIEALKVPPTLLVLSNDFLAIILGSEDTSKIFAL